MSSVLEKSLVFAAVPCLIMLFAGVTATFKRPGLRAQSYIQHFAAGVVFSAAAGEILPEIKAAHSAVELVVGFSVGVGVMLGVRAAARKMGGSDETRSPIALFVTVAIDIFLDGALIGIGFAAGGEAGVLLTIALTLELLFLGVATASSLEKAGLSRRRIVGRLVALDLLLILGAAIGGGLIARLPHAAVTVALSFGLAALLFLVVEELLVEAHEVEETPGSTAAFFVGFLLLTLLEMGNS